MSNQLRLLLLIVVISGALCTVEDYVIMSQCAHNRAIHLAAEGTVSVTDISQTQNITIVGLTDFINNDFKIALYAKETQRYLCFNEYWRLVGMKELRDTCYFNETIVHGYFVFRSVADLQRRVGFTRRGKAVGPKKDINNACYQFTKIPAEQFFHQHTDYFAPKSKAKSSRIATATTTPTPTRTTQHKTRNNNNSNNNNRNNFSKANNSSRGGGIRNNNNNNNSRSNNNQNQQHSNGHSNIISNNNNTTYLSSTRQSLVVDHNNNNSNNNSRTRENGSHSHQHHHHHPHPHHHHHHQSREQQERQPPEKEQHQVRHHHNDPNVVARRHQHEQKQKRRERNRARATASPTRATRRSAASSSSSASSLAPRMLSTSTAIAPATKGAATMTTRRGQHEISPTNVVHEAPSSSSSTTAAGTTAVASTRRTLDGGKARKGRRRKGDRYAKKRLAQAQRTSATLPSTPDDDVTGFDGDWWSSSSSTSPSSGTYASPASSASTFESYAQSTAELEPDLQPELASSSTTAATSRDDRDPLELSSPPTSRSNSDDDDDVWLATPTLWTAHANSINSGERFEVAPSAASELDVAASATATATATFTATAPTDATVGGVLSDAWWSAATASSDQLAATLSAAESTLAATPQLAEEKVEEPVVVVAFATTTSTEGDSSSSSSSSGNSSESGSASRETLETAASSDDAFWSDMLDGVDTANETSAFNFTENTIEEYDLERNASGVLREYLAAAPTAAAAAAAAFWHNRFGSLRTTTATADVTAVAAASVALEPVAGNELAATSASTADNSMTDYTYSTRSSINNNNKLPKISRHRNRSDSNEKPPPNQPQRPPTGNTYNKKYIGAGEMGQKPHYTQSKSAAATKSSTTTTTTTTTDTRTTTTMVKVSTTTPATVASSFEALEELFANDEQPPVAEAEQHPLMTINGSPNTSDGGHHLRVLGVDKNIDYNHTHNRLSDDHTDHVAPTAAAAVAASGSTSTATLTTKNSVRKSMQRLLATPFHQLTYVRNDAGDIDIDNIDNISIYPDLMDAAEADDEFANRKYDNINRDGSDNNATGTSGAGHNSRLTIVNGYHRAISGTAALPESIRIAKIRINNEQRRQRHFRSFA